jgi:hypothetical protein
MKRQQAADKKQLSEAKAKAKSEKKERTTLLDCDDDDDEEEEAEEVEAPAAGLLGGALGGALAQQQEYRDQGFTRPSVLILCPYRTQAYKVCRQEAGRARVHTANYYISSCRHSALSLSGLLSSCSLYPLHGRTSHITVLRIVHRVC